jgi:flagellar biosynthesis protein FlhF
MQKRLIFVVGASGTSRTTVVAKIAAMLSEQNPTKEIVLASLSDQDGATNQQLQCFARLLNLPSAMLNLSTPTEDFDKMTDYDFMVIDVDSDNQDCISKIQTIQSHLGNSEVGVILTLPGSTSSNMVKTTISRFESIKPIIALTKLDECETNPADFSAIAESGAKIGVLSGTRSVIDAAVFASENILLQYLIENFSSQGSRTPPQTGSE